MQNTAIRPYSRRHVRLLHVRTTWLDAPRAWFAEPTTGYRQVFTELVRDHQVRGPLAADVQLAALAIDHGPPVASNDADFARFDQIQRINPLTD